MIAAASCSSGSGVSSTTPTASPLPTEVDQPATFTAAQMLAATGGATPVEFAQPAHGRMSYGPGGTMIYTPEKGFAGVDQLAVTTTASNGRRADNPWQ
jgi:hypothetical protein